MSDSEHKTDGLALVGIGVMVLFASGCMLGFVGGVAFVVGRWIVGLVA